MSVFSQVSFNPAQPGADAGGILRVGQQTTLFDGKELGQRKAELWDVKGTGTESFLGNKEELSVTAGQYVVKQSKRFMPYFSGKSQRVEETFDTFGAETGVIKRFGYFSSNATAPYNSNLDGFYVENDGNTIRLVVVNDGVENLNIPITSWSGYNDLGDYQNIATWDNFTVVEFKFLWLGGAVLVVSVKNDDGFVEAHRYNYSGNQKDVFMKSPNQPLRYEIRSTTGTGTVRPICSQCATEGSVGEGGDGISVFNEGNITAGNNNNTYALIGVRKTDSFRDVAIQIVDMAVTTSDRNEAGILQIVINPTLSSPLTYTAQGYFEVGYATNQTVTRGTGRVIASFPAGSFSSSSAVLDKNFLSYLGSDIDNVHDEYVLCYQPVTGSHDVHGILNLKEY